MNTAHVIKYEGRCLSQKGMLKDITTHVAHLHGHEVRLILFADTDRGRVITIAMEFTCNTVLTARGRFRNEIRSLIPDEWQSWELTVLDA